MTQDTQRRMQLKMKRMKAAFFIAYLNPSITTGFLINSASSLFMIQCMIIRFEANVKNQPEKSLSLRRSLEKEPMKKKADSNAQ